MNNSTDKQIKQPCLFLFDGGTEGVEEPALSSFTGALLSAISVADPMGALTAELRGGLCLISDLTTNITEVTSEPMRSGHTKTHDMSLFRLLLWDMAQTLSEGAGAPSSLKILDALRSGREECLALSDASNAIREKCDAVLKHCIGYVGSCPLDAGNPIQRSAFFDGLMHLAFINNGAVSQQRSMEGDEEWELNGAKDFKPGGLKWIDHNYGLTPDPFKLEKSSLSMRGSLSVDRLKRKTHTTVEGRVFRALVEASWTDRDGQAYRFAAAEPENDILQAILPDGKFTDYLFNRDHNRGGGKAGFIIDELGFEPDDWRFLAAQFYDGLLLSEPRNLIIKRWKDNYGAQFNVYVKVTSRAGKSGIMRTGWMLEPNKLPRLVTAVPDRCEDGVVEPPTPPVLRPTIQDDNWFGSLFVLADDFGRKSHAATLPTPMLLEDFGIIEEGECGSAYVLIADTERGLARWLIATARGDRIYKEFVAVSCNLPSQSLERAEAYARTFARVLALNGVPSRVETYYT